MNDLSPNLSWQRETFMVEFSNNGVVWCDNNGARFRTLQFALTEMVTRQALYPNNKYRVTKITCEYEVVA